MQRAVLIIDKDFSFLFWLGRLLDEAGYEALPAKNVFDAFKLIQDWQISISLLIFDCSQTGAEQLMHIIRRSQSMLRTICLDGPHAQCVEGVHAVCHKPETNLEDAKITWLRTLEQLAVQAVTGTESE